MMRPASGHRLPGRRVEWKGIEETTYDLEPGDYTKDDQDCWWLMPPCDGPIRLGTGEGWKLNEREDGTLDIGPVAPGVAYSIWINKPTGWHGFLTDGVWITVSS